MPDVSEFYISIPEHGIKYLGITFPLVIKDIQIINYASILEEIKMQFERWKGLKLSLWGKIVFYLLNMLPI